MKDSKKAFAALAIIGGLFAYKKISARRKAMKEICDEYGIAEKTPFGLADKIREMSDDEYRGLKNRVRETLGKNCCCKN